LEEESPQASQVPIEIPENVNQNPTNPLTPMLIASGIVFALILTIILIKRR
jgi:hypothetical protein